MSLLVNGQFPPINPVPSKILTTDERSSAVNFVNRINYLLEEFAHDKMVNSFLPDTTVYHFHGVIKRQHGARKFFEDQYGYLIPGVSRHATNHILDRDGKGVMVRYHEHLVRYAWPKDAGGVKAGTAAQSDGGLPTTWLFSPMIDRSRKTDEGWKIFERYIGPSVVSSKLDPPK
jgi:hypothetical protein